MSLEAQTPEERIMDEIHDERQHQIEKGWSPAHDDEHGVRHLLHEIELRSWGAQNYRNEPREALVQIAALAVAAIETIDRLTN